MALDLQSRLKHAWNAFSGNRDPTYQYRYHDVGYGTGHRPDRARFTRGNERSLITARYSRIAMDVAALTIQHVQLDEEGRFVEVVDSGLNECLTLSANIDQTGRAFIQDAIMSMLDEGCVAIVATNTTKPLLTTDGYDVLSLRTGKVVTWYPKHVKVKVYNEDTGKPEDVVLPKNKVAIIENPLYAVVNEPNSTMQRLIRKLNLLDVIDEQSGSGKLDLIIQLPYVIKTEARRAQADKRRKDIEEQLSGSKYGIAYTDGTERITQLNRPVENNLLKQIEYLMSIVDGQLGITQGIMDGTADEKTRRSYEVSTVEPCAAALVDGIKRTFLSKTARSQGKSIMCFRDPFSIVTFSEIAESSEKFVANGIMSANEIRGKMGMKPSDNPEADALTNSRVKQNPDAPMDPGVDPAMAAPEDDAPIGDTPISDVM